MARKLGIEWKPALMRGKTPEAAEYQRKIGRAYFDEGMEKFGGDVSKALMYFHGGPDQKQWGPKTHKYAEEVLGRVSGTTEKTEQSATVTPTETEEHLTVTAGTGAYTFDPSQRSGLAQAILTSRERLDRATKQAESDRFDDGAERLSARLAGAEGTLPTRAEIVAQYKAGEINSTSMMAGLSYIESRENKAHSDADHAEQHFRDRQERDGYGPDGINELGIDANSADLISEVYAKRLTVTEALAELQTRAAHGIYGEGKYRDARVARIGQTLGNLRNLREATIEKDPQFISARQQIRSAFDSAKGIDLRYVSGPRRKAYLQDLEAWKAEAEVALLNANLNVGHPGHNGERLAGWLLKRVRLKYAGLVQEIADAKRREADGGGPTLPRTPH